MLALLLMLLHWVVPLVRQRGWEDATLRLPEANPRAAHGAVTYVESDKTGKEGEEEG